jgi:MFS family permease
MYLQVIGPFAFGFFLSYLLRVVNAVAGPALAAEFGFGAADLGLLTSAYFLTFAAAQLPVGVALDRYGPTRTEGLLILVAAAGSVLFALAGSLGTLILGRALIGLGVSSCLIAAFKAYTDAVPRDRMPFVNGLNMAAGGLGALMGGAPAGLAMQAFGWRGLFLGLAVLCVLATAILFLYGPSWRARATEPLGRQFAEIGMIMRRPVFLALMPFSVACQATVGAVQGLWAGPWLRDVAGLGAEQAGTVLSFMAVWLVIGFLVTGWTASHAARFGVKPLTVAHVYLAGFILAQIVLVLAPGGGSPYTWYLHSFLGTASVLIYPALTNMFEPRLSGRVNSAINFLVFAGAFAFQWGIGLIIDWVGPDGGAKRGYDVAFLALICLQLAAGLWAVFWLRRIRAGGRQMETL